MFLGNPSLVLRLDVNHVFDYVLDEETHLERGQQTIFKVKPLTISQYTTCRDFLNEDEEGSVRVGSYQYGMIRFGLVGWVNYFYEDNYEPIDFCEENLSTLREHVRGELAHAIETLCEVDKYTSKCVKLAIRWSDYLRKNKSTATWKCSDCSKTQMAARNCDGHALNTCRKCGIDTEEAICEKCGKPTVPPFKLKLTDKPQRASTEGIDYVTRCPIRLLDSKVIAAMNAITYIDDSNSLPTPGAALEQSAYFFNLKQTIQSESNEVMRERDRTPRPGRGQQQRPPGIPQGAGTSLSHSFRSPR